MPDPKPDILQGTLDLMVLKTLDAMGPQHGYRIGCIAVACVVCFSPVRSRLRCCC